MKSEVPSASSQNVILLDLEKNLWFTFNHFNLPTIIKHVTEISDKPGRKRKAYLQIRSSKRYTRKVVLTSGCLNDLQIFKLIQILNALNKFEYQPKIILWQVKAFLFLLSNFSTCVSSKIQFSQAFEVFQWLEQLKMENNPPKPPISMYKVNRICKIFYGKNSSALIRRIHLVKTMNELIKTDDTILNIGTKAGYKSRDNFITAFKHEFATTPGVLRLLYRDHLSISYERL